MTDKTHRTHSVQERKAGKTRSGAAVIDDDDGPRQSENHPLRKDASPC